MPNSKQAGKRMRVTAKRTARNRYVKSTVKTSVRGFRDTLAEGNLDQAGDKLQAAVKTLDKAVSKGVVHKNAAARKKSRMTKHLNKAAAAQQAAAE
ncbi:MAG TPA: 30S ribosomal protein S20 [Oscillospiraceae bacterium]|nr:30S ribosomal protein S20 [Oscillospiraceae bacterium]